MDFKDASTSARRALTFWSTSWFTSAMSSDCEMVMLSLISAYFFDDSCLDAVRFGEGCQLLVHLSNPCFDIRPKGRIGCRYRKGNACLKLFHRAGDLDDGHWAVKPFAIEVHITHSMHILSHGQNTWNGIQCTGVIDNGSSWNRSNVGTG